MSYQLILRMKKLSRMMTYLQLMTLRNMVTLAKSHHLHHQQAHQ
jgi:hypothetical protein